MNETLELLALIRLLQQNHGKNNYNTSKDESEVNLERNGNRKQYTNEHKGRYPKDNNSGRTSHRHTHMKRRNMNTRSQHKFSHKRRRKGNSDDVQIVENEDDSEDNPYTWNSDHEKIEPAEFSVMLA